MTHPPGNIYFGQSANFTFPRSYIQEMKFDFAPGLTWTLSGNEFTLYYSPLPLYRAYIKFQDAWWDWSSHAWPMRHIVEWCYEVVNPGDPEINGTIVLTYIRGSQPGRFALEVDTLVRGTVSWPDIPQRDQPYWQPDPP